MILRPNCTFDEKKKPMAARTKSASVRAKRLFDEEQALKRQGILLENHNQQIDENNDDTSTSSSSSSYSYSDDSSCTTACIIEIPSSDDSLEEVCVESLIVLNNAQQQFDSNNSEKNNSTGAKDCLNTTPQVVLTTPCPVPTVVDKKYLNSSILKHASLKQPSNIKPKELSVGNKQTTLETNTGIGNAQHYLYSSPYSPQNTEARSTDKSDNNQQSISSIDSNKMKNVSQLPSLSQIYHHGDSMTTISNTPTITNHYQYTVSSSPAHLHQPPLTMESHPNSSRRSPQPPLSPLNSPSVVTSSASPVSVLSSLTRNSLPRHDTTNHYHTQPSYHYHYPNTYSPLPNYPISSTVQPVLSSIQPYSASSNNSNVPQNLYVSHHHTTPNPIPHRYVNTLAQTSATPPQQVVTTSYPPQVHLTNPSGRLATSPLSQNLENYPKNQQYPSQYVSCSNSLASNIHISSPNSKIVTRQDNPNHPQTAPKRKREYLKDIVTDTVTLGKMEYEVFMAEQQRKREGNTVAKKSKLFNMDYTNNVNLESIRDKIEVTRKRDHFCNPAPQITEYLEIVQGVGANSEYRYGDPLPNHIVKVTFGKYIAAQHASLRLSIYGRSLKDEPKERKFIQTITTFGLSVTNEIARVTFSDLMARHASHKYGKMLYFRFTLVCDNVEVSSVETQGFTTITLRGIQKRQQRQNNKDITE